ncbi:hypothetical protein H0H93_012063 [Arthromyces matolae]|nr:hypothetical protein H0H93_012063 [Arthromyces matolae]
MSQPQTPPPPYEGQRISEALAPQPPPTTNENTDDTIAQPLDYISLPPPLYSLGTGNCTNNNNKQIHIVAMWSESALSRRYEAEEWTAITVSDHVYLESDNDETLNPTLFRHGDTFNLQTYNNAGDEQHYMTLQATSIIPSDSPFFITFLTWSSRISKVLLRIPIGHVVMTVNSLFQHIDYTHDENAQIIVFPTVLVNTRRTRNSIGGGRFVNRASRNNLDPENALERYVLLHNEM